MRFFYLTIFLLASLVSCSPQARFNRLIAKNPNLLDEFIISQWDTVIVPELEHDTVFYITPGGRDSFLIRETNTTIVHNNGALQVSTRQPPDTIFLQREYYTPKPISNNNNRLIYLGITVLFILVLFLGGYVTGLKK